MTTAIATRRRFWTDAELDAVRSRYGREPTAALARALRRTAQAVYLKAIALRLSRPTDKIDWSPAVEARYRALHAAGYADEEAAAALGCQRATVSRHRWRLGLPSNRRSGASNLSELRAAGVADLARAYGLPGDLKLRHVQIVLLLLERGALAKRAIVESIGLSWPNYRPNQKALHSDDGHHTYLGGLIHRGLVQRVRLPVAGGGRARRTGPQNVYRLTLHALELLAAAGGERGE